RPAALIGAAWAGLHPTLFTALYWISARSDLLAGTFALATVGFSLRGDRLRWLALPAFALALTSKESVLLLPLVIVLLRTWDLRRQGKAAGPPLLARAARDPLTLALAGIAAAFLVY